MTSTVRFYCPYCSKAFDGDYQRKFKRHVLECEDAGKSRAWMQTYSGVQFRPFAPSPEEVQIKDIAGALAKICRFGGHTNRFYSVAQHSVEVSRRVPAEHALTGLLHDAPEAYIGDMIQPIKQWMERFREMERGVWAAIALKFKLPTDLPQCVKDVDLRMLYTERKCFLGSAAFRHRWDLDGKGIEPYPDWINGLPPEQAEQAFIGRFIELAYPEVAGLVANMMGTGRE